MTRLWAIFTVLLMAVGPTAATARDPDRDETESRTVYQIDVEDRDHRGGSIDRLVVVGDGGTAVARAWHGVARRNQSRIDYSSVPFAGQFSEHRYDKEDFVEANRVGVVRIDGNDLILALAPGAQLAVADIGRVAVLNGPFAYETRRRLSGHDHKGRETWDRRGREIGLLYRHGDGNLLALIRPFVVTDSALW